MGERITAPTVAICIPDVRLTAANNLATPTQAGPKPGGAIAGSSAARLDPRISSGQDTDVDIYVSKAGNPLRHPLALRGAAVVWSADGGTVWNGWNHPGFLHQVDVLPTWSSSNLYPHHDLVTIPTSGKVVAIYSGDNAVDTFNTAAADTRVLSPATWTWAAKVDVESNVIPALNYDSCLAILPDERLLAMILVDDNGVATGGSAQRVYYSDDEADSWTLGSSTPFSPPLAVGALVGLTRSRMLSDSQGNVLFFRHTVSGTTASQFKSINLGLNFTQVGGTWSTDAPTFVNLLALKSGFTGFVCESDGDVIFKRIGSFSQSLEAAPFVVIRPGTADAVTAWVEGDGTLWAAITDTGEVELHYSLNEGSTWVHMTGVDGGGPFFSGDPDTKYLPAAAAFTMGGVVAVGNSEDDGGGTTYDGMVWATRWGGFSNVEAGPFVWYLGAFPGVGGITWLPIELPTTISLWVENTTGGTATLIAPGTMRVDTPAVQTFYWSRSYGTIKHDLIGLIEVDVQSGGQIAALKVGAEITNGDGVNRGVAEILFSTTQYAVEDDNTPRGIVTHGVAGRLQVLWTYDGIANTFSTWYKERTSETWILGHDAVAITAALAGGDTHVAWGHLEVTTSTSDWYQFHHTVAELSSLISFDTADELAELLGKSITGLPYPIPQVGPDDRVAHLSLRGGPGVLAETFTIPVEYDNGIERIFPADHPSPTSKWCSTDNTETEVARFSPNEDGPFSTSLGNTSLFLYAEGINWRIAHLQGSSDGGATFPHAIGSIEVTVGSSIPYTYFGEDAVEVDPAGSGSHARYVWFNELVGGTAFLSNDGEKYRRIRRNTEGAFNADATTRNARLWLSGIDGTEPVFDKLLDIWAPRGMAVFHDVGAFDSYRIVIPAQTTANGRFEIGNMMLGAVHPAGRAWEYGFVTDYRPNSETETDRALVNRVRRNGKVKRTQTFGWPTPLDMTGFRAAAPNPNYLAADTGPPLAAVDDVPFWLAGVLEEIGSGETPVVVLWNMPLTDGTLTDPTLFMGATMASSVGVEHATGREGVAELLRVSRITATEL